MRTPDDVRRLVDEAPIITKADPSARLVDDVIDNAEASQAEDEAPPNPPIIENDDETIGPTKTEARTSARRAAFRSEPQLRAIRRIRKQWPQAAKEAERIVEEAYEWYQKRRPGSRILINNIAKIVSCMAELNEKFAMLEVPGQPACIINRSDAMPISLGDFKLRLNGTVVCLGIDSEGATQWEDAQEVWRESADKHVYNTIAFTSKPVPAGTMNLFTGFGVKPKKGDCHIIYEFLLKIICNNNVKDYAALIKLIAWQIQNIGTASRIVVILFSKPQQVGKGTLVEFILLPIFGDAGFVTTRLKDITGEFNAVLRGKALVGLDETLFAGDHVAADQIKGLAATDQIPINEKFLPRVKCPAGINLWVMSNNETPVYLEEEDYRYWPLRVSAAKKGNVEYWRALRYEIENGGREAFLYEMLNYSLGDFFPQRDVPRFNEEHRRMIAECRDHGSPRVWLEECIDREELVGVTDEVGETVRWMAETRITSGKLIEGYRKWVSGLKGFGIKTARMDEFWGFLSEVGCEIERTSTGNTRRLPNPKQCAEKLKSLSARGVV